MKKIKYQRYKEIFLMLLPDNKGLISKATVYKSNLIPVVKKIISPLLEELEALDETLDFNEFYDAMEMLMKALTPGDKSSLLLPCKPKILVQEDYNFKPRINPGRSNPSGLSLYERSRQKKQDFSKKIQKEREVLEAAEMKECKFNPAISNAHRKTQSNTSINLLSKSSIEN